MDHSHDQLRAELRLHRLGQKQLVHRHVRPLADVVTQSLIAEISSGVNAFVVHPASAHPVEGLMGALPDGPAPQGSRQSYELRQQLLPPVASM